MYRRESPLAVSGQTLVTRCTSVNALFFFQNGCTLTLMCQMSVPLLFEGVAGLLEGR